MVQRKRPSLPRKSAQQRRSKQTVQAMLEAAAQIFEQEGYDSATTDRIAERAGVSIGTLYQYFPDKEAILNVLLEQHVARAVSSLADTAEQVGHAGMPLAQAVRCLVQAVVQQQLSRADCTAPDPRWKRFLPVWARPVARATGIYSQRSSD